MLTGRGRKKKLHLIGVMDSVHIKNVRQEKREQDVVETSLHLVLLSQLNLMRTWPLVGSGLQMQMS